MIRIALTGSIGMGKSTTALLFAEEGIPVWDADAAVHRLYGPGAPGTAAIAALVPEAVGAEGVDRARLRAAALSDPALLRRIEQAIHPLVAQDRAAFLERAARGGAWAVVCDVPLLFETGAEESFDRVVVVSAPEAVQKARVLERAGMNEQAFAAILARQMPDAQKRALADHVIITDGGIAAARAQVRAILDGLRGAEGG